MIKPRFWDEEPETAFQYLITENPLIKDSQTAKEVLETLFDKVTFLKKSIQEDGTEACLFYVEDETLESIEYLLFEVYIGLDSNDYNYNYYEDEYAVLDAADNFE